MSGGARKGRPSGVPISIVCILSSWRLIFPHDSPTLDICYPNQKRLTSR